jgi:hypothetical protein
MRPHLTPGRARRLFRHEIVMRPGMIVMPPSRCVSDSERMDIVAVLLGIAMFAILYLLITAIDRV